MIKSLISISVILSCLENLFCILALNALIPNTKLGLVSIKIIIFVVIITFGLSKSLISWDLFEIILLLSWAFVKSYIIESFLLIF